MFPAVFRTQDRGVQGAPLAFMDYLTAFADAPH